MWYPFSSQNLTYAQESQQKVNKRSSLKEEDGALLVYLLITVVYFVCQVFWSVSTKTVLFRELKKDHLWMKMILLCWSIYLLLYFMTITVNFIRLFGRSLPGQFCAGGKQGRGSCTGRSFKIIYSVLFKDTVSRDFLALTIWITQFCMVFLFSWPMLLQTFIANSQRYLHNFLDYANLFQRFSALSTPRPKPWPCSIEEGLN